MPGKTTAAALTKARQICGGLYGKSKENLLNLLVIVKFRKCETNFLSPRGRGQVPSPRGGIYGEGNVTDRVRGAYGLQTRDIPYFFAKAQQV